MHGRGYLVPRRDGTVLAGSTVEMVGFRKEVTVGGLAAILRLARTLVPALADAPVTGSLVELPSLHRGPPAGAGRDAVRGLVLATGHFRNGILLAPDHRRGHRRAGRDRDGRDRSGAVLGRRASAPD